MWWFCWVRGCWCHGHENFVIWVIFVVVVPVSLVVCTTVPFGSPLYGAQLTWTFLHLHSSLFSFYSFFHHCHYQRHHSQQCHQHRQKAIDNKLPATKHQPSQLTEHFRDHSHRLTRLHHPRLWICEWHSLAAQCNADYVVVLLSRVTL